MVKWKQAKFCEFFERVCDNFMEWNSKSAKTLFALVGFGVLLFWGLENLPLLGSIFGWIFALLAPFILDQQIG